MQPKYRLFVDESGDHAYKLLEDPSHRYLCLLGVWFRLSDAYPAFQNALDRFKLSIWGPRLKPVLFHRSKIINQKGAFGLLRDAPQRASFEQGLLEVVERANFTMVCVVIDKKAHLERYASPFHPYHYCLAALMDRYSGWLGFKNAVGDVMAETRGTQEDSQLRQAYTTVYESGTLMFPARLHQRALTTKELKIKDKAANEAGLQLADILAHPVKQALLAKHKLVPDPGEVFGKRLVAVARGKFNRHEFQNRVRGYGAVCL